MSYEDKVEEGWEGAVHGTVTPGSLYRSSEEFKEIAEDIVLEGPLSSGMWKRAVITDEEKLDRISSYLVEGMHLRSGEVGKRESTYGAIGTETFRISRGLKSYLRSLGLWERVNSIEGMGGQVWVVYSIDYRNDTIREMGVI